MEDEKLADKLLDRILMVLMPYDQIDVERIKAKLTVVLDDYQICPKQEALVVYTEGKNDYYLRKFLLAKAVAGRQERTLRQYKDEVGRVLRGIGKDADTITADDIQVYLGIRVKGYGFWDGRYICTQAKHTINENGFTTTVTGRRILEGY